MGAFLVPWLVQQESWRDFAQGPYPTFFRRKEWVPFDWYLLGCVVVGMAFLVNALVAIRRGPFPRSDGYGGALTGFIFLSLSGIILFLRPWAALHS